jgi:pimeloyl-ACP methyl ester carboxylesterase
MSGLAYWHEGEDCKFEDSHLSKDDAAALQQVLEDVSLPASWQSVNFDPKLGLPTQCQDEIGLFFRVWRRPVEAGRDDVVIAFRGTSNNPDWIYGNLWWVTRFFVKDNQFSRSTRLLDVVLKQLHDDAQRAGKADPRVVVTGHSLGGGLAQHALYNYPSSIKQAIVFDPSPVTAYVASSHGKEVLESEFDSDLKTEARIIRIYESDEILSNLRIWHKIFFPSHLQIQEVRFAFYDGRNSVNAHSMRDLTFSMHKESKLPIAEAMAQQPWHASLAPGCTQKIEDAQKERLHGKF